MSLAIITTFAVLENLTHPPDKPKTCLFDAQVWVSAEDAPLILRLRYFNSSNLNFPNSEDEQTHCLIIANVSSH